MSDFSVRSDNVDVEQIMRQIRSRIREKRGVDYTEEEIRELANVKLEKFLDPRGVRSDLLEQFRRKREASLPPNFKFEDTTLFETHRGFLAFIRRLLRPILKLFFNPNPISHALNAQARLNKEAASREMERERTQSEWNALHYTLVQRLVTEIARTSIEMQSLTLRVESLSTRVDHYERRVRELEQGAQPASQQQQQTPSAGVPGFNPGRPGGGETAGSGSDQSGEGGRRRRRRRRSRRGPGSPDGAQDGSPETSPAEMADDGGPDDMEPDAPAEAPAAAAPDTSAGGPTDEP